MTTRILYSAVIVLSAAIYTSAGPDTAGREFLLPLPNDVSANLTLMAADDELVTCSLTSANNSQQIYVNQSFSHTAYGLLDVQCDKEITITNVGVYGASPVLPNDVLGRQYKAAAGDLVISAIAEDTKVDLILSSLENFTIDGVVHTPPPNMKISLDSLSKGKSVRIQQPSLRGSQILSDNPISVLNGDRRGEESYLISLPPVNTWGTRFILSSESEHYKILGLNSRCTMNDVEVDIDADLTATSGGVLVCDKPALVTAYQGNENLTYIMQAITQFPNNVALVAPEPDSKLGILVAEKYFTSELRINGQAAAEYPGLGSNSPITDGYIWVSYDVPKGIYRISHQNPTVVFWANIMDSAGKSVLAISLMRMANTGVYCHPTRGSMANDGLDNDCDSWVDEELSNGKDDDGDGRIDEDLATNDYYGDLRGRWRLSYTVMLLVILIIVLVVLIAVCHWQCSSWAPKIKDIDQDPMMMSYDSGTMVPARYSLSGSRTGFTITRR